MNLTFPRFDGQAACADGNPDRWFPEQNESAGAVQAICRGCPVREPCLRWALDNDERHGIWAGLSQLELDKLRGRRRAAARSGNEIDHGTERGDMQHRRRGETPCPACLDARASA